MSPRWIDRFIALALVTAMSGCSSPPARETEAMPSEAAHTRADGGRLRQAATALETGDAAAARGILTVLGREAPDDPLVWSNLGIAELRLDRPRDAITALERAAALAPSAAATHNLLGVAYRRSGRIADAEHTYHRALALDPHYALTHYNLGVLYEVYLGQPQKAAGHYRRFLVLDPDAPPEVAVWIEQLEFEDAETP